MKKKLYFFKPLLNLLAIFCFVTLQSCSTLNKKGIDSVDDKKNLDKKSSDLSSKTETSSSSSLADSEASDADEEEEGDPSGSDTTPENLGEINASETLKKEEIDADAQAEITFPLVYNEFVEQWVKYFSGRGKDFFTKWLGRSTRYIPLMKQVLKEEGLPEDLIYLSMIESGFNTKATSRAKAVGPWQFIKGTGQRYDMRADFWIDERRDFIKSTRAAAKYLKELHQIFGSWYLAAASYNAGEGRVLKAVRQNQSRNFWELSRKKKNFRAETRNYVPKIIAAALVSKNPERYGFHDIPYEEPLSWTTVTVSPGLHLKTIAKTLGLEFEDLRILNPELRRGIVPPKGGEYVLRVPKDKKDLLLAKSSELKAEKIETVVKYKVRSGDTIDRIAKRHGTSARSILEFNDIQDPRKIRAGKTLTIPSGTPEL